jgi:hypothetical protein
LGDPRFDPDHWHLPAEPDFGFVRIPAGPFLMGTREEDVERVTRVLGKKPDHDEINPRPETYVDEFYIARYPVTVAQFRAFVEDRRAADPGFKLTDEDALNGLPTHPVRYVTWHEAMAYCKWLTEKMQEARAKNQEPRTKPSFLNSQFFILNFPAQRGRVGESRPRRAAAPDSRLPRRRFVDRQPQPFAHLHLGGRPARPGQGQLRRHRHRHGQPGRLLPERGQPVWLRGHDRQRVGVDAQRIQAVSV